MPVRGQNNVQGASDVGAVPLGYTDFRPVKDPKKRAEDAADCGAPPESLSLKEGLMVSEIVKPESGVRRMYIMGETPVISDPAVAQAEHWFQELEFLAVHDLFLTETARYADVVLPGSSFAEKTGSFVNTERRIQLAHKAVASPGQARGDLEILIDLSNRLGLATRFQTAEEVMREIARVTPSWHGGIYPRVEGAGVPFPVPTDESAGPSFLFDDRFPTADGKGVFVPVEYAPPVELPDEEYPFVMNTGRQLYHWHTGTMTRRASGLDQREPTPIVEIHPDDARELGLEDGDLVRLTSRRNTMVSSTRISERVARGHQRPPRGLRGAGGAAPLLRGNPGGDAVRGRRGRVGAGRGPGGAGVPRDGSSRRAVLQRERSAGGAVHSSAGRSVPPRRGAEPAVRRPPRACRGTDHAEGPVGPNHLPRVRRRQTTPARADPLHHRARRPPGVREGSGRRGRPGWHHCERRVSRLHRDGADHRAHRDPREAREARVAGRHARDGDKYPARPHGPHRRARGGGRVPRVRAGQLYYRRRAAGRRRVHKGHLLTFPVPRFPFPGLRCKRLSRRNAPRG